MKKYILPTLFVISLAINAYFIGMRIMDKQQMDLRHSLYDIKLVPYDAGVKSLFGKLRKEAPQILKDHDFVFIQTWDTIITQGPRLAYTLRLDSLFAGKEYAAMGKLLLSEMPETDIRTFMKNHHIRLRSFTAISDANEFISSVFTFKKAKAKSHPMQVLINKKGEILYCNIKVSGIEEKDSTISNIHHIINQ